jgi:methylaspartate mutase sigma subunit
VTDDRTTQSVAPRPVLLPDAPQQELAADAAGAADTGGRRLDVIVTSVSSDAHTWNLVYLELLLEELGCRVTNLGGCTPDETIVEESLARHPDLIVVSSLNGHGGQDGIRLIDAVRSCPELVVTPMVIGGKLDVTGGGDGSTAARLLAAGFDAVFEDTGAGMIAFQALVHALAARAGVAMVAR